jgi:serine protease AprX
MSGVTRDAVDRILASIAGRRFTQDSPILPDVWLTFALSPDEQHDVLITPHLNARAGQIALELRAAVNRSRETRPDAPITSVQIAHMPGIIAARLYFDELIRFVLPRTPWWRTKTWKIKTALRDSPKKTRGSGRRKVQPLFPLTGDDRRAVARHIPQTAVPRAALGSITRHDEVPLDFVVVAAVSGTIRLARAGGSNDPSTDTESLALVDAFASLFDDWPSPDDDYELSANPTGAEPDPHAELVLLRRSIWRVSNNRPTEAAITKSTLAVKADAARRLFNVSCQNIEWAVIDSGIDATHPAFYDWSVVPDATGRAASS